jgi:hypothetical protein
MTEDTPARPRSGRIWSEEDDARLRQLIEARETTARIAQALERTQDAIRGRAAQLGITVPSSIRPWRRHWAPKAAARARAEEDQEQTDSGDPASESGNP